MIVDLSVRVDATTLGPPAAGSPPGRARDGHEGRPGTPVVEPASPPAHGFARRYPAARRRVGASDRGSQARRGVRIRRRDRRARRRRAGGDRRRPPPGRRQPARRGRHRGGPHGLDGPLVGPLPRLLHPITRSSPRRLRAGSLPFAPRRSWSTSSKRRLRHARLHLEGLRRASSPARQRHPDRGAGHQPRRGRGPIRAAGPVRAPGRRGSRALSDLRRGARCAGSAVEDFTVASSWRPGRSPLQPGCPAADGERVVSTSITSPHADHTVPDTSLVPGLRRPHGERRGGRRIGRRRVGARGRAGEPAGGLRGRPARRVRRVPSRCASTWAPRSPAST